MVDITAVKAAQQQAEQLTVRLNAVLDNIKSAILLVAADGEIIRVNHAFLSNLTADVPETFDQLLDQLMEVVNDPDAVRHHALSAMQHQRMVKQHELTLRDGRVIACDYSPIFYDGGVEHLWHCRDITSYKQAMRDLQVALEREIQLNKLRNDFVSIVSHEFRTPLSIISSSNETLMHYYDRLAADQRTQRHLRIETQVRHMTAMLDDALHMGKMESSFAFAPKRTDITSMVNEIVSDFRQTFPKYRIVFDDNQRICEAEVDPKMFRQIIHNLLSNAIKYSEEGSQVTVELKIDQEYAVMVVADQGIGIPSSEHDRMFQMFKRGSNVQNIPGSGLGLVVVNNAIKRHNGSIAFESEVNRGTRFVIKLPASQTYYRQSNVG
jgi:signal transduction histidine kinase